MSWCCRPCRCGTIVHTDDGRDPANACTHGDATCGACAPGDCEDCRDEITAEERIDLLGALVRVLSPRDPWDNGQRVEDDTIFDNADQTGWNSGGRRFV